MSIQRHLTFTLTTLMLGHIRLPWKSCFVKALSSPFFRRRIWKSQCLAKQSFFSLSSSSENAETPRSSHNDNDTTKAEFVFFIDTPEDMEDLGGLLAVLTEPPACLLLDGDLGAGKTALSRGYLRTATADPNLLVTSPTYLLSNVYTAAPAAASSTSDQKIYHMDLYRLDQKNSVPEVQKLLRPLNLDHIFATDVTLLEWPTRLGPAYAARHDDCQITSRQTESNELIWPILPSERLEIDIRIRPSGSSGSAQPPTTDAQQHNDILEDAKGRIVKLISVGERWTRALQTAVQEGLVDDFLEDFNEDA